MTIPCVHLLGGTFSLGYVGDYNRVCVHLLGIYCKIVFIVNITKLTEQNF